MQITLGKRDIYYQEVLLDNKYIGSIGFCTGNFWFNNEMVFNLIHLEQLAKCMRLLFGPAPVEHLIFEHIISSKLYDVKNHYQKIGHIDYINRNFYQGPVKLISLGKIEKIISFMAGAYEISWKRVGF